MKLTAMNYQLSRQRIKALKADDRALKPCNATHRTFKVTGSELNQKRRLHYGKQENSRYGRQHV